MIRDRRASAGSGDAPKARRIFMPVAAALLALAVQMPLQAAEPAQSPAAPPAPVVAVSAPKSFVTRHQTSVHGRKLSYTAIAEETYLTDSRGDPIGSIFSFSYINEGRDAAAGHSRPVLFAFNGGPGSSSIWLHMGVLGPKIVELDAEVNPSNLPPFPVRNNPNSILDVADLVFIDPIGTGYSRPIGKGRYQDFFGVDEDAEATAQFIERWLTRHNRWNSPKYVIGESYGSQRASVLPRALMGGPFYTGRLRGITLNGIILLGTVLGAPKDDGMPRDLDGPAIATALMLPSLAATAWYHEKIDRKGRSIEQFDAEVSRFALGEYAAALAKESNGTLRADERKAVAARLVDYTGLPAATFATELKVALMPMANSLLADRGVQVGAYDSRYTLPGASSLGDPVADDAAMVRYVPGFVSAFNQMLADDLKVDMDRPYGAIVWKDILETGWTWKRSGVPEGQTFAQDLVGGMRRTPQMRVFVASGYYDLVTTPTRARWDMMKASPPKDRIIFKSYPSGHMLYLGGGAKEFADDIRGFIAQGQ